MDAWVRQTRANAPVSRWSGGQTTQLAIEPPGADYAERSFLWRVSSASVELEQSDFTPLPDYWRYIATLDGEITLQHNDCAPVHLKRLEVHTFDGAAKTVCEGRCTDFNLMLRKGAAEGSMTALCVEAPAALPLEPGTETLLIYCAQGACELTDGRRRLQLAADEWLQTSPPPETLSLSGCARLLVCRMRRAAGEAPSCRLAGVREKILAP